MKDYIQITKFDYLRTPKFKWSYQTKEGGSFSNSGEYNTLQGALKHCFQMQTDKRKLFEMPVRVTIVHGYDEKDEPVETHSMSYFFKLLTPQNRTRLTQGII